MQHFYDNSEDMLEDFIANTAFIRYLSYNINIYGNELYFT